MFRWEFDYGKKVVTATSRSGTFKSRKAVMFTGEELNSLAAHSLNAQDFIRRCERG